MFNKSPEPTEADIARLEEALLEVRDVERVIRLEVFDIRGGGRIVAAKVSLDEDLTMKQVSIVVAIAERRVQQNMPEASSVYIVPDVWVDPDAVPSTSSIVTLSYD